jgi:hypothetical protein
MRVKPEFSIEFAREHLFYLKRDDQMELYLEGLRKAGVASRSSSTSRDRQGRTSKR